MPSRTSTPTRTVDLIGEWERRYGRPFPGSTPSNEPIPEGRDDELFDDPGEADFAAARYFDRT